MSEVDDQLRLVLVMALYLRRRRRKARRSVWVRAIFRRRRCVMCTCLGFDWSKNLTASRRDRDAIARLRCGAIIATYSESEIAHAPHRIVSRRMALRHIVNRPLLQLPCVYVYVCVNVCVYVSTHTCRLTHWNRKRDTNGFCAIQGRFKFCRFS